MLTQYTAYGLTIASTIALPELTRVETTEVEQNADLLITEGEVPHTLQQPQKVADLYEIDATKLLYRVPGVARYLVRGGGEIVVEAETGSDADSVRLFLLNPVLGALLQQRRQYTLRASAVDTPRGAALLIGNSGAGKSTLAAALNQRGWRLLCDDIGVLVQHQDGRLHVLPGYPVLRLWQASLRLLRMTHDGLRRVRPALEKYVVPVTDFCTETRPLHAIYVLNLSTNSTSGFTQLDPLKGITTLQKHLYPHRIAIDLGNIKTYWSITTVATQQARLTAVQRVAQQDNVYELAAQIEADWT